jgi:hypothetical protein
LQKTKKKGIKKTEQFFGKKNQTVKVFCAAFFYCSFVSDVDVDVDVDVRKDQLELL